MRVNYYTASKHAVQGYFKSLQFELNQFNIKVSVVEPMWLKTNLGHNAVSPTGSIAVYDVYRKQVNAYTKKSLEEADAPNAVPRSVRRMLSYLCYR
ncbi:MAG: hypothetical protein C0490_05725 [Marivirga sp.]|nr:hypothetical protein [Marivirga sp.]